MNDFVHAFGDFFAILEWAFYGVMGGLALAMPICVIKIHARLTRIESQVASLSTLGASITAELKKMRVEQELTNRILCQAHGIEYPEENSSAIRVHRGTARG